MVLVGIELSARMVHVDGGLDAGEFAWQRGQVVARSKGGPSYLGSARLQEPEDSNKEELAHKMTSSLACEFSDRKAMHLACTRRSRGEVHVGRSHQLLAFHLA